MALEMLESSSQNSEEEAEIDPEMLIGGIKVNYYIHCTTQLWLFSKFINQEKESELVILGKLIEDYSFRKMSLKEVLIDSKICIDLIKKSNELIIYDIKKSSKFQKAHEYQMLYYLWYLKNIKGIENIKGKISYPKERRVVDVLLTNEKEKEIEEIIKRIKDITSLSNPPKPSYKKYCRRCAYFSLCWSD